MNNSSHSYKITPKKKKKTVSAKKSDSNETKPNKKLTRIATDPDMKSTLVNLPSLMQTGTRLTPTDHATTSPTFHQSQNKPKTTKRKQTGPARGPPAHLKRKPLPSMPKKPLPSAPAKSNPLPSSNFGSNGITTTTRTAANGHTTTTTTYITYIDSPPLKAQPQPKPKRSRCMTAGSAIPTFVPLNTTHNEMKQLQFSGSQRNINQDDVHNIGTISFSTGPQNSIQYQYSVPNTKPQNHTQNYTNMYKNNVPNSNNGTNKTHTKMSTTKDEEYDLQYDDEDDELLTPQGSTHTAPHRRKKRSQHLQRTKTFSKGIDVKGQSSPRRRLSDSEVATPTSDSPYHPNNYKGSTWYAAKSPHNTHYTQNTVVTNNLDNPRLFQQQQRNSRSATTFTMPIKPKHRATHSKSNAIPPPHVPQKAVSFSPQRQAMPAPYVPPIARVNSGKRPTDFGLGMIMLPGQKKGMEDEDSDDESEPSLTVPRLHATPNSLQMQNSVRSNKSQEDRRTENKPHAPMRRNSDTIVYTPCDSSAVRGSTFSEQMSHAPKASAMHVRSRINDPHTLEHNLEYVTDVTPVSNRSESPINSPMRQRPKHSKNLSLVEEVASNTINTILPSFGQLKDDSRSMGHRRHQSAPGTPSMTKHSVLQPVYDETQEKAPAIVYEPPKNVSMVHQTNKKLIDKLLGFKGSIWNFDNELVDVFHEQCRNVSYETLVPNLIDVLYPTMLSSLALPAAAKSVNYPMTIKYNLSSFVSVEEKIAKHSPVATGHRAAESEILYVIAMTFSAKTTIQMAVSEIVHKIKQNHLKYSHYLNKLHLNCFVLKVCGREEYLKLDGNNNKIMSLSHIRNCIRKNEVKNLGLVLLYDDSLNDLHEESMRQTLRASYNRYYTKPDDALNFNAANKLKYEKMGTNVITDVLVETIGDENKELSRNMEKLNTAIESELFWLKQKLGSLFGGDQTTVQYTPSAARGFGGGGGFGGTMNTMKSEMGDAFEWSEIDKEAILLPEFEHPVEFCVESLSNIMLCPRFRAKNKSFFTYVLRIELMFGVHVFEQCSWDIIIPKEQISNAIQMPHEFCSFSTADEAFHYACLPREAVWCFTLYGINRDAEVAKDLAEKKKKQNKKQKKNEPKILRAFIDSQQAGQTYKGIGGSTANFIHSKKVKEDFDQMIGTESINDFYNKSNTVRSMLSVEDEEEKEEKQYISEAMAWCRLPMIDHNHCLRKGVLELKLWTVAVFEKVKGGPKIDPFRTGNWKKFGSTRDCNLRHSNFVVLKVNFVLNYAFDVVAPIVNQRRPHYIRSGIKMNKRSRVNKVLSAIIQRDGIYPLDERDKLLVYSNKDKLMRSPATIPTFLRSVSWLEQESRMEAYDYLDKWAAPKNPEDMIELLRYEFADNRIRLYAINCLNQLDDYTLNRCLLQLVQALKNEAQHSSFLARFLMVRALHNPFQIGHYLFWHLKSEYHDNNCEFLERYGLLLAEYLLHLPYYPLYSNINLAAQLCDECDLINRLKFISLTIKRVKSKKKSSNKNLLNLLQSELIKLNSEVRYPITLPLNPAYRVHQLHVDECRFMSSAKVPLWLVFSNADRYEEQSVSVMFKCGDDLRQDILTLQLISIMDAFWLSESIDLNMMTYQVIGTGYQVGMLELILNSKTTNDLGSSFNQKTHWKYIMTQTPINTHLTQQERKDNYARSVAGFSVATWTLGIGDRHPDNIMIHQNGTLFHIDFGHFLGNFKEKDMGAFGKWKRERTPFVFTNAMKYCIEGGTNKSRNKKAAKANSYAKFVKCLFDAYCEIRTRYKFFLNLLLLMVPSQMPELITESDVAFFREVLQFDLQDDVDSIASHVEATLKLCLADKNKKFDDMFHKINHM